ncbi:protein of unknown function [Agreia sp. COWG]|nr:protein of unknown function [Agreia sp. COWG]
MIRNEVGSVRIVRFVKNTGGVLKRPKRHAWKACIGQPIESSNLSATAHTPGRSRSFGRGGSSL